MDNIKQDTEPAEIWVDPSATFRLAWRGPRNLPKKSPKAFRRLRQKQARKRNRGAYSGR